MNKFTDKDTEDLLNEQINCCKNNKRAIETCQNGSILFAGGHVCFYITYITVRGLTRGRMLIS